MSCRRPPPPRLPVQYRGPAAVRTEKTGDTLLPRLFVACGQVITA